MRAHKMERLAAGLVLVLCVLLPTLHASGRDYPILVVYTEKPVEAYKKWNPLAQYFSEKTGNTFKVTPFLYDDFIREVETGRPALVVANLLNYALLQGKAGLIPLAIPVWNVAGRGVSEYGAVIFTRKNAGIKAPAELAGKVLMVPSKFSLAALIGIKTLNDLGVKVADLASIKAVKTHENVVFGVINGAADAGIVRTGTLEHMAEQKLIKLDDILIINRQSDNFPFVRSTALYPEWLLCATGSVPPDLVDNLKKVLASMNMNVSRDVFVEMGILGWKMIEEGNLPSVAPLLEIQKIMP